MDTSIVLKALQQLVEANADADAGTLAHFCGCLTREIRWPGSDTNSSRYGERIGVPIWEFACAREVDERARQELSKVLRCSLLYVSDFRLCRGAPPAPAPLPFMTTAGLVVAESGKWLESHT